MVAAWSQRVLRGRSRVELDDETQVTSCLDFRVHVPVLRNRPKRGAWSTFWAGPAAQARRQPRHVQSSCCTAHGGTVVLPLDQ